MTYPLDFLTTRQLAAVLKRAPETLIRWRRLRVGPPFRQVQGRVLYDRAEIMDWLESCTGPRWRPTAPADTANT